MSRLKQRVDALEGGGNNLGYFDWCKMEAAGVDATDPSSWPPPWRGRTWDPQLIETLRAMPPPEDGD